jgi:ribosome biogenesis GTPase
VSRREYDESDVRIRPNKRGSRPRSKDRPQHTDAVLARVVAVDRGRYQTVVAEADADEREVQAMRARELRRQAIVPGDLVGLVGDTSGREGSLARIVRIQERSTLLRRSADDTDEVERVVVANADRLVIVVAAADPEPRPGFIDRALVAAHDADITPVLVITKADLREPTELVRCYTPLVSRLIVSRSVDQDTPQPSLSPDAVEDLRQELDGHICSLLGHSGVGKSTMVNALTGATRATGHVNAVTGRGRHTSSSAVALRLPGAAAGSWIVDTPGVRSFGLAHVDTEGVVNAFEDLVPATADCPRGCTHADGEPGCALDAWVADGHAGECGATRLESLRRLLASRQEDTQAEKELGSH